jgi:hypothetical protein
VAETPARRLFVLYYPKRSFTPTRLSDLLPSRRRDGLTDPSQNDESFWDDLKFAEYILHHLHRRAP